mgnify:CR=1 FL=1
MFENLSERLERSFKILKGQGKITELNVAETLKEVRRSLLDADVNYKIAKDFTNRVKEKALGMNVLTAVKPGQMMVKIVHDELAELMGGKNVEVDIKGNPAIILMSGLQGSGKTTFSGKFANLLKNKKGKKPLLVACDVYRPAAIEQLKVLGEQIQVPVYSDETTKDPVRIALDAIKQAKAKGYDVVIVDTAGRLAIDEQMMNEIAAIKEAIHPNETLFVVDAMTGQDAVNTAREFNERLDFNGVILTKLDGDTRGGAVPVKVDGELRPLDVAAAIRSSDQALTLSVINPGWEEVTFELDILGGQFEYQEKTCRLNGVATIYTLTGPDDMAYNTPGQESVVKVSEKSLKNTRQVKVGPFSANVIVLGTE